MITREQYLEWRHSAGLTQSEVAARIGVDEDGVSSNLTTPTT